VRLGAPSGLLPVREAFVVGALLLGVGAWGQGGTRAPAETYFAEWADEEGFHSPWRMCNELGRRFVERLFEWVPYLYSDDLGEGVSESDERGHRGGDHQRNRVPLRGHQASVGRTPRPRSWRGHPRPYSQSA
jgi:hypothetical protein